ncbi:DNA repair helicase XPB [Paenibacillus sp. YN15]|uniref:DNA repair helicase XPB n=1 Tax=Paenibacillus sp. YN15 TaxID=1742774 RepID=UPI000DCCAB1B|nr:DNA repair helicase XPB [Paenibacillus sp. YN15]RAV04533.1 helicase [Paenibacillus sp. YN15]
MEWKSGEPPLWIQKDLSIWLEAGHPEAGEASAMLSGFAELVKTPGSMHQYRITPFTLWNAAASGLDADRICRFLHGASRFGLPQTVQNQIRILMGRFGLFRLTQGDAALRLAAESAEAVALLEGLPAVSRFFGRKLDERTVEIGTASRGLLKQEMARAGYPVVDEAGFLPGEALAVRFRDKLASGAAFSLRSYQREAVEAFARQDYGGGSGVVVMPCGAGKTVVGLAVMARYACETLILTVSGTSVSQWKRELLQKTSLTEEYIGEYSGERKEVRPVTIATYHILTHGAGRKETAHLDLFRSRSWGLIIYDEVHLLPAPVFRMTAELQSARRLGLTATLIREDGLEADVFGLVGPKRYEISWKQLEREGWLAKVECTEVRVPFSEEDREGYDQALPREKIRVAAENSRKLDILRRVLEGCQGDRVLIIGQYLDQLRRVAEATGIPLICGDTRHEERERLFQAFRQGEVETLVVSRVANFAVDLPDASVAVQISGSFGSRQEEAQRMGRILRPKSGANAARFYTLVTEDSREQDFAVNRQLFLLEQGYRYEVKEAAELIGAAEGRELP